jgi:hypothetical protein
VCVETADDDLTHGIWWAEVTFTPRSGSIQEIAASSIGISETGEGSKPRNYSAGSRKGVRDNISASRTRTCWRGICKEVVPTSLDSNEFISGFDLGGGWNWVHSWVNGAWAESTSGRRSASLSLQGNGG